MAQVIERQRASRRARERALDQQALPSLAEPMAPRPVPWEIFFWFGIVFVAFMLRMYDLGRPRAAPRREPALGLLLVRCYIGQGYVHDPLMHGPYQFHAKALMYFLFGDSDVTARLTGGAAWAPGSSSWPYFLRAELGTARRDGRVDAVHDLAVRSSTSRGSRARTSTSAFYTFCDGGAACSAGCGPGRIAGSTWAASR